MRFTEFMNDKYFNATNNVEEEGLIQELTTSLSSSIVYGELIIGRMIEQPITLDGKQNRIDSPPSTEDTQ